MCSFGGIEVLWACDSSAGESPIEQEIEQMDGADISGDLPRIG